MKMMWAVRHLNHVYIFWRGEPVYKSYDQPGHPSVLLNPKWPGAVWIINEERVP